jgi:hypothetical protein
VSVSSALLWAGLTVATSDVRELWRHSERSNVSFEFRNGTKFLGLLGRASAWITLVK